MLRFQPPCKFPTGTTKQIKEYLYKNIRTFCKHMYVLLISIEEATADVSTDKLNPLQLSDIWTLFHSSQKDHSRSQKPKPRRLKKNIKPFIRSYSIKWYYYLLFLHDS